MITTVIEKRDEILIKLMEKLETEIAKEPINTSNVSALSQAMSVLTNCY